MLLFIAVFKWRSKNRYQSNYSCLSHEGQTAPWINQNPEKLPAETCPRRGKNRAHNVRLVFGFEESSDAGLNRKRKRPENRLQEASCPLPLSDFFCLHFSVGYFVEPTIIETKNPEDRIMKEVKFPNLIFLSLQAPSRVYSQVFRHSMKWDPSVFSVREFKKRRRQRHCRKRKNDWFKDVRAKIFLRWDFLHFSPRVSS